eukprot:gene7304-13003_t
MDAQGKKAKGRPKRKEPLKMVYFLESTFDIWNKAKKDYSSPEHTLSSDEFAKLLLRCFSEGSEMGLDSSFRAEKIDKEHCYGKTEKVKSVWSSSEPQYAIQLCHQGSGSSAGKDNEGTISKRDTSFEGFDVLGLNEDISTIDGDPFSDSDSNTDDEDSYSSSSASLDSSDDGSSDSSTDSSTDKCATLTSAKETSIFIAQLSSEDDEGLDKEEVDEIHQTLHHSRNLDIEDQSLLAGLTDLDLNRTFIFKSCDKANSMDLEESLDDQVPQIQASAIANATEIKKKASDALTMLFPVDGVGEAYRLSQQQRVIVSVEKLKELKGRKCLHVLDNGSVCHGVLD